MTAQAQPQRRKLTKAEAGRLGGLTTSQRHGKEHFAAAGRAGGAATVAAHGVEHMAAIGRKGFSRLAGRIGCFRSRKAAVEFLQAKGRLAAPRPIPPCDPDAEPYDPPDDDAPEDGGPPP